MRHDALAASTNTGGSGLSRRRRRRLDFAAATTLQALATPSLLILGHLREEPATVGDLADAVAMERSAVSHRLRLLRRLGLVHDERRGRSVLYSLTTATSRSSSTARPTTLSTSACPPRTRRTVLADVYTVACWHRGPKARDSGRAAGASGRSRVRKRNLQALFATTEGMPHDLETGPDAGT